MTMLTLAGPQLNPDSLGGRTTKRAKEHFTPNGADLHVIEPRTSFYSRPVVRGAFLIGFLLLFLFLIGVVFDSTYFRF